MNLQALLQAAGGLGGQNDLPNQDDILVQAASTGQGAPRQAKLSAGDERAAPKKSGKMMEELIPRKGMFGVKGTLRDILGTVGDAFLVQSGRQGIYGPQRDREKVGSAQYDMTTNPLEAVERLNAQGFPEQATELAKLYESQEIKKAQLAALQESKTATNDDKRYKREQDFGNWAARLLQSTKGNPEKLATAQQLISDRATKYDIEADGLGLSNLTPERADLLSRSDMTVRQQEELPRTDRRLDISDGQLDVARQNAESNRTRANRPPQRRAAPQPTKVSEARPLLDKIEKGGWSSLTKGEQDKMTSLGMSPDKGSGKSKRKLEAPSAAILKQIGLPAGGVVRKIN